MGYHSAVRNGACIRNSARFSAYNSLAANRGGVVMSRRIAVVLFLLTAVPLFGSAKKKNSTQAENIGFTGPIKSVSSTHQTFMPQPVQPDGPTVIYPLFCEECEFDREGNQVTIGMLVNGTFVGSHKGQVRDEQGRVQEEVEENEKGDMTSRHVYTNGPSGKLQDDFYMNGKLFNTTTFRYDGRGDVISSDVKKPDGTLDSHTEGTLDSRGNQLETLTVGPGDTYWHILETYNRDTGNLESFSSLNRDGSPRLWFRLDGDKVVSFWQQPGEKHTYGSGICFDDDGGTRRECRDYNSDGTYLTTDYSFTDKKKHNPVNVTLYDTEHQVVLAADYEYEVDLFGNWTKRTVWVRQGQSGQRELYEKDTRTLTYYSDQPTRE